MITGQQIAFELLNGVVWGLILGVIALGLCLIYGLMGVINMAHGSLYMVGAIGTAYLVNTVGFSFWLVLVLAGLIVAVLTTGLNTLIFKRVLGRDPAIGLLATAGAFLTIDNTVLLIFGGEPQSVMPPLFSTINVFGVQYPAFRLAAAGVSLLTLLGVALFLRCTTYGLWMRAVPQNRELASVTGVPIRSVNMMTASLAGLTAGIAGALSAPISGAYFQMGLAVIASCFIVVVIGGMGNLTGAVIVAILFGIVRGLYSIILPPTWSEVAALATLLCVLFVKPNGLLGKR